MVWKDKLLKVWKDFCLCATSCGREPIDLSPSKSRNSEPGTPVLASSHWLMAYSPKRNPSEPNLDWAPGNSFERRGKNFELENHPISPRYATPNLLASVLSRPPQIFSRFDSATLLDRYLGIMTSV